MYYTFKLVYIWELLVGLGLIFSVFSYRSVLVATPRVILFLCGWKVYELTFPEAFHKTIFTRPEAR